MKSFQYQELVKCAVVLLGGLAALSPSISFAQGSSAAKNSPSDWYVGGSVYGSYQPDSKLADASTHISNYWSYDLGAGYGFNAGVRVNRAFRLQFDVARQTHSAKKANPTTGEVQATGKVIGTYGLISAYYDVPVSWTAKPFVSLGIGYANIKTDQLSYVGAAATFNDSDSVLAGRATFGAAYPLSKNVDVIGEYQYLRASDYTVTDSSGVAYEMEYSSHNVGVGIRYSF